MWQKIILCVLFSQVAWMCVAATPPNNCWLRSRKLGSMQQPGQLHFKSQFPRNTMDLDGPSPKRRRSSESPDSSSSRRSAHAVDVDSAQPHNDAMDHDYNSNNDPSRVRSQVSSRSSSRSSRDGRPWQTRRDGYSSRSRSRSRAYTERSYSSEDGRYSRQRDYSRSTTRSRSPSPRHRHTLSFTLTGEPLEGHMRGISCVKFSPDGTMIASACKSHLLDQVKRV